MPSPLAIYRYSKGYSQSALSAETGLARETINRIENGHSQPTLRTARILAAALDFDPEALFPPGGDHAP